MKKILFLLTVTLCMGACCRRPLEDIFIEEALIPISIDWQIAGLDPSDTENLYRASVWFFAKEGAPFAGKNYKEFRLDSPLYGEVSLPVGRYSVLLFNNSVSEFSDKVGFRGTENYDTFEYFVKADNRTRSSEPRFMEPDLLAAWRKDDYEVTEDMVMISHSLFAISEPRKERAEKDLKQLLMLQPERLTKQIHTIAHVKYLKSAVASQAKLTGISHSVRLASKKSADDVASFVFPLTNPVYDIVEPKDGTIEAMYNVLGIDDGTKNYSLEMVFTLNKAYEGSRIYPTPPSSPFTFDVTPQLFPVTKRSHIDHTIRVGLRVPYIILPDFTEGHFEPDVVPWEDELPFVIPI